MVSVRQGTAEVIPFAVLVEAPHDYVMQTMPGQAMSQEEAMRHAQFQVQPAALEQTS